MKITAKTTKEQLKHFLGANVRAVKEQSKELYDRIAYADKMSQKDDSKVQRKDLVDLAKEVIALLGSAVVEPVLAEEPTVETTVEPVAENSVKKLAKGVSKKQKSMEYSSNVDSETAEATAEVTEVPTAEPTEEKADKKTAKKSVGSKKATKKEDTSSKEKDYSFPETFEVEGTKYTLAPDITSMEDLYKAVENDEDIVLAFLYTKKMLKEAPYFYNMLGTPKSFPHDLDLADTIYVSEEFKIAYLISKYTEGCYSVIPEDFEEVDGVRYAGTMIYQIYRAV